MIRINVIRKAGNIASISVSGHAYANDPGFDLVCAGVSSIAIGTLNACDQLLDQDACDLEMIPGDDPRISIQVHKDSKTCQTVLKTMLIQCKTIEEQYKNYVEIEEMEG